MGVKGKQNWRLILDPPAGGPENMAVDEAMLRVSEAAAAPPTFRLYEWSGPTISLGYLQDYKHFASSGLPIVRRITGGRAVLHDMELTYSIVCGSQDPLFSCGISGAYSVISTSIVKALNDIGVKALLSRGRTDARGARGVRGAKGEGGLRGPRGAKSEACFHSTSRYEVLAGGKKLVGSSQRRFKGAFLQHGSILLGVDWPLMTGLFGQVALKNMTCIEDFVSVDKEALKTALVRRLSQGLGASFNQGPLTSTEEQIKSSLVEKKYSKREWNLSKTPEYKDETPLPTA